MKKSPLIVGAAVALLALTACTGPGAPGSDDASATFAVGTCLADFVGIDSDRTTVVDCTEDHYFDVVGVETWPEMDAEIAASDAETVYDAITGDEASELGDAYWDWAYDTAIVFYLEAIGLAGVTIDGATAEELSLSPGARFGLDYSLATRDAFVAGDHTTLFSSTWWSPEDTQIQVALPEGVTVADTVSGALPADLQGCFTRDPNATGEKYTNVACTESHNGQYLAYVNGRVGLGAEFMATVDPSNTIFPDYGPVDDYCTILLDTIYPGLLDSASWGVWSDQAPGGDWEGYDGTIDPEGYYPIYCAILGTSGTTFTGDVISGDVNVSMTIG